MAINATDRLEYTRGLWEHAREYYRIENSLYGRCLAFCLEMEHYRQNDRSMDNSGKRIQPKGQQLYNLIRHKTALVSTAPFDIHVHPSQPMEDALAAELGKRVLQTIVRDPKKRYKTCRRRMIVSALAGGRGVLSVSFAPNLGPNGDVVFDNPDPRRFFVSPGAKDMHHELTPWVMEEIPMRWSAVMRMKNAGWSIPKDLRPDNWQPDYDKQADKFVGGADAIGDEGDPPLPSLKSDGVVTVLKTYHRFDPFSQKKKPRMFWMDEAGTTTMAKEGDFPPISPQTGQPQRLVSEIDLGENPNKFPDDYMCISFPFHRGSDPHAVESAWYPKTEVFPYMQMTAYTHPLRLVGTNDTRLNHSLQIIDNTSLRNAWEQLRQASAVMIARRGSLKTAEGHPFVFTDEPLQIAWADDPMSMNGISFFQAPGMNTATSAFRNMLSQQWTQIGTGDIAMPTDRSRDIAVGTIQALQQQGDLPVRLHLEDLQLEESCGLQAVLDMKRETMAVPEMLSWVADNGELSYAPISSESLSHANVMVTTEDTWTAENSSKVQAIAEFAAKVPPILWPAFAPRMGFSPQEVGQISQAAQMMMGQQQQQQQSDQQLKQQQVQQKAQPKQ